MQSTMTAHSKGRRQSSFGDKENFSNWKRWKKGRSCEAQQRNGGLQVHTPRCRKQRARQRHSVALLQATASPPWSEPSRTTRLHRRRPQSSCDIPRAAADSWGSGRLRQAKQDCGSYRGVGRREQVLATAGRQETVGCRQPHVAPGW